MSLDINQIVKLAEIKRRNDPAEIKLIAENNLHAFAFFYLDHYFKSTTPDFHWEIYHHLENPDSHFVELVAFRGSGKSTMASLALPLWSAVFKKRNFIILLSDTFPQAKLIIANLIYELEYNEKLREHFGSFKSKDEEWTAVSIFMKNGVRIVSKSRGQKVRGLRHLQYRPDLVVADDVENIEDVRQKEQRDKTEEWFYSDVMPAVDKEGKVVLIGNLLHTDSFYMRVRHKLEKGGIGVYREFPIFDKNGKNMWEQEFPPNRISRIKKQGNRFYLREYELKIIPDEGQIISEVQYYDKLPKITEIGIGVDLAISEKESADNTAVNVIGKGIDGNFYNLRTEAGKWGFNKTLETIYKIYLDYKNAFSGAIIQLGFEDVAYQKSAIEEFTRRFTLKPVGIKRSKDKRSRLLSIEPYFESKQIYFRKDEDADVVNEIVNFGVERFDDRMDAFEISLNLLISRAKVDLDWI